MRARRYGSLIADDRPEGPPRRRAPQAGPLPSAIGNNQQSIIPATGPGRREEAAAGAGPPQPPFFFVVGSSVSL